MAKNTKIKQTNFTISKKFGFVNFFMSATTFLIATIFLYCTTSTFWICSTEIYVVDSSFRRNQGLFRECTYAGHTMDCEVPYPNLVLKARPLFYLVSQFSMPFVVLLEFIAGFVYIQGHPCTAGTIIHKNQKRCFLTAAILMWISSVIGIVCCIFTLDCTQRNYCMGGISNQYWLMNNEDAGVQQFSMGHASLTVFITCFGNLILGGYSFVCFKRMKRDEKIRNLAKVEGRKLADELWVKKYEIDVANQGNDGFI